MRISAVDFDRLPLRVHTLLADVPLHDVWAIDLPHFRTGITLAEFLRATKGRLFTPLPLVRVLLAARLFVGRLLGWDRERTEDASSAFAGLLTSADRQASLVPPGTPDGPFRVVYCFENEQLSELTNRTVHAASLSAIVESSERYRFYFAVYVQNVGTLTPLYMALIDPVRNLIVYPALLKSVRANWIRTFAPA